MVRSALAVLLAAILFYGAAEAWPLLAGPALRIASPIADSTYPDGIVSVSGTAARIADLTVNGLPILHDADGSFQTTLALPRGGSILTVAATDRFGRTVTARRAIFVP